MSLEELSWLAQIVLAAAVVVALVYAGAQLQRVVRAMRCSSSQAHASLYHSIIASLVDDGEFARIWLRGLADPDALDEDERVRFFAYATTLFRFYESSRVQWLRNLLDEEHWHTIQHQAADLWTQPGIQGWWVMRRSWHSAEFREWIESLPPEPPAAIYGRIPQLVRGAQATAPVAAGGE